MELVGYVGSAGAALMWLPQVATAIRGRRVAGAHEGISPASFALALVFNALLVSYGALEHAAPVVLAGCINFCCAVAILVTVATGRRVNP